MKRKTERFSEDPITKAMAKLYSDMAHDMEPHHFSSRIYRIAELYQERQNDATYAAVMDTFPGKAFGAPAGEYETGGECDAYADGYNQACAELRQTIAKIFGKEPDSPAN